MMSRPERPTSPHLQIYRWELTMALSILHRATGAFLSLGLLFLVCWLLAVAAGADRFAAVDAFLGTAVGTVLLLGWTFSLFLHMGNGIRHLFWDIGVGFDLGVARASGWAVLGFAVVATGVAWWCGLGGAAWT